LCLGVEKSMAGKHIIGALFILVAVAGCSAKFHATNNAGVATTPGQLDPARSVVVAVPADGAFGEKVTVGSGYMTAERTAKAFERYTKTVHLADANLHARDELLDAARRDGAGYLAIPTIIVWEPRFTAFTGRRAHATVQLVVTDVPTGHDISSVVLEGYSKKVSVSRTTPDRLLPYMIGRHLAVLYGRTPANKEEDEDQPAQSEDTSGK
jgi:hypothetical protein